MQVPGPRAGTFLKLLRPTAESFPKRQNQFHSHQSFSVSVSPSPQQPLHLSLLVWQEKPLRNAPARGHQGAGRAGRGGAGLMKRRKLTRRCQAVPDAPGGASSTYLLYLKREPPRSELWGSAQDLGTVCAQMLGGVESNKFQVVSDPKSSPKADFPLEKSLSWRLVRTLGNTT